jgi:CBS-domain-containing membrane protein
MANDSQESPMYIRDLMTVGVVTCAPETPIKDIARVILERDLEGVVVLDLDGHAVGIVSQDELVTAYGKANYANLTAEDIMRDGVPQVPPDIPLSAGAQLMQDQGVRVFFLMHHAAGIEYPAAQISYRHFLRHIASDGEEDLRDIGIKADRTAPLEAFIQKRNANQENGPESDTPSRSNQTRENDL